MTMNTTATRTYTRARPVAGIGYGQKGFWGNRHFSTVEAATVAFAKYCEEIRAAYAKPGRNWTGKYIEKDLPVNDRIIAAKSFTNIKKNGKPGVVVHTVHLYPIDEAMAEHYLRDPFYAVES